MRGWRPTEATVLLPDSWIPGQVVRSRLVHYIERSQIDPSRPRVCSVHNPSGPGAHVLTACGLHRSPVPNTHDREVDCLPCVMTVVTGSDEEVHEEMPEEKKVPEEADV